MAKKKAKKAKKAKPSRSRKPKMKRAKAARKAGRKQPRKAAKAKIKSKGKGRQKKFGQLVLKQKTSIIKPSAQKAITIPLNVRVGSVMHFYTNINVAVVKLEGTLNVGDDILIEGATTNFRQQVESMQIDHNQLQTAKKGDEIGMKVIDKVREGDVVYKV